MSECIISIFLIIYCCLSMLFTIGLFVYHTKVIINNRTTKEHLKKLFFNPFNNPYSRNLQRNCQYILFPRLTQRSILDILKWDNDLIDDFNTLDNKNNLKMHLSIESEEIEINNKNISSKYSDVKENTSSEREERIIPKFSYDLNFNNNYGNPL